MVAIALDEIAALHWRRIKEEFPSWDERDIPFGTHSFHTMKEASGDDTRRTAIFEDLIEDIRLVEYMSARNPTSFGALFPDFVRVDNPDIAEQFDKKLHDFDPNDTASMPSTFFLRNLGSQVKVRDAKMQTRDEVVSRLRQGGTVDLGPSNSASYDSLHGSVAYSKTITHPAYTLSEDNYYLSNQAIDAGIFDSLSHPTVISLYSGSSFIELGVVKHLERHLNSQGDWQPKLDPFSEIFPNSLRWNRELQWHKEELSIRADIIDAAHVPVFLAHSLWPEAGKLTQGVKYIEDREFSAALSERMNYNEENLVFKLNAATMQTKEQIERELQAINSLNQKGAFWYTVPLENNRTSEMFYGSWDNVFSESFLTDIMLVSSQDKYKFEPFAERTRTDFGSIISTGYRVRENVTLLDQRAKRYTIPAGTLFTLHKSYRFDSCVVDDLCKSTGFGRFENVNIPGIVGIYKHT